MTARAQSHTAPLTPEAALVVCAAEFPRLAWSLKADKPRGPRHCRGESDTLSMRVDYDSYGGWHVSLLVRVLKVADHGSEFGIVTAGGASLADTLHRLHMSLTTWVGTLVTELGR